VNMHGSRKDLLAGATFVAFGLAFAVTASTYEVGSALRMGPGYFPVVLGGLLVVLGILIGVKGFVAGEGDEFGPIPWKAAALLVGALFFFGFTVRGLGLVPSVFVAVFLSAMAGRGVRPFPAAVIAGSLTGLSVLIFVAVLQLRLPLFGPWLQG
jgi:hypothetical protein